MSSLTLKPCKAIETECKQLHCVINNNYLLIDVLSCNNPWGNLQLFNSFFHPDVETSAL